MLIRNGVSRQVNTLVAGKNAICTLSHTIPAGPETPPGFHTQDRFYPLRPPTQDSFGVQIVRSLGKTREMKGFPRLAAGVLSTFPSWKED
jgi:hypothetical protein